MPISLKRSSRAAACIAALLLIATRAGGASETPAARSPPDEIGRYHVTVTIQEQVEVGTARSAQTVTRDLRDASGIIIDAQGIVVTAAHVARSTWNQAAIKAYDGTTYSADVLHVIPDTELAVLKIARPWRFDIAPPPVSPGPAPGDTVTGIGLPADRSVAARSGTVLLPRYDRVFKFGDFGFRAPIVLEMRVESGFSGGPVFDAQDRWLGMIVGYGLARNDDGDVVNTGQAYILPAQRVLRLIEQLP